jgi:preprotein translocase subunit SecG
MITFLTVLHVLVCVFLILVVLLQAGKGGGMGIAFGGGGSQTVFGSSGAGNFLTRLTSITAAIFLITSLGLAHFSSQQDSRRLQHLAEQKQLEKKADEDRATKLKQELEKARESAQKPGSTPAEGMTTTPPSEAPAAPAAPAATETKAGDKKKAAKPEGKALENSGDKSGDKKPPATKSEAKPDGKPAEAPAADGEKPAAPAKKKRVVVGPEGTAEKPAAEKKPESAPAAPAAP